MTKENFHAVLFAPDGDLVTDFHASSIEDVEHALNDMGSRWIFYPIATIAKDDEIVRAYDFQVLVGLTIKQASEYVKTNAKIVTVPIYNEQIILE